MSETMQNRTDVAIDDEVTFETRIYCDVIMTHWQHGGQPFGERLDQILGFEKMKFRLIF